MDMLVWIDCEMTGLNLATDALVEVAVLVTDGELKVQGEGLDLLIPPSQQALEQMLQKKVRQKLIYSFALKCWIEI